MRYDDDTTLAADGPSYRVSRRSAGLDPSTKRLAIAAGCIGGGLLVLVAGWSLTGHHRGGPGGIPVIEAEAGPIRVKPLDPGGLEVFVGDDAVGQDVKAAMAPPPEKPNPQALRAQEGSSGPLVPEVSTPVPVPAPAVTNSVAPPAVAPHVPAAPQRMALANRPATPAPAAPVPTMNAPSATGSVLGMAASLAGQPAGSGQAEVQLAALDSEHAALAEWDRLAHRLPELFGKHRPSVSRIERDGRSYYRLRTGGFADVADATTFCQRVREKGGGCSIAAF